MKIDIKIFDKLKWILLISWPVFGCLLFDTGKIEIPYLIINFFVIFFTVLYLLIKKVKIKKINYKNLNISVLLSCYVDVLFMKYIGKNLEYLIDIINMESIKFLFYSVVSIVTFPTILFCIYLFIDKIIPIIKKEICKLTKVEKKYLKIYLGISSFIVILLSIFTSVFSVPLSDEYYYLYDVMYTTDSGLLAYKDAYIDIGHAENDIRQHLFGVFSLPIAIPAHIISELLFFIPSNFSYYVVMTIMQFLLLGLTIIMIGKLLKIKDKEKKYLYFLFSLSYPFIMFGLILEQYVIGLFYLILTIYLYDRYKNKINYIFIGAVGTLVTSGIMFFLITKFRNIKDWISKLFKCFVAYLGITILSGQLYQFFSFGERFEFLTNFSGKDLPFYYNFCQFSHFVEGLFLVLPGKVSYSASGVVSYKLELVESISIIGIIIMVLMFISFILNRKNRFAIISFIWVLFSFVILGVVGWGTVENGLILYSLYFAWAYYSLFYLLVKKIFKNSKICNFVLVFCSLVIFSFAIIEMFNVLKFAFMFYLR